MALEFGSSKGKRGLERNYENFDLVNSLLVEIDLPHNSHLQSMCIKSVQLKKLDLSLLPRLVQLTLCGVSLLRVCLPRNAEMTKLELRDSYIKYLDFTNGVMIRDLILHNVSATPNSHSNGQGKFLVGTMPVEIELPCSPHLEDLTIHKTWFQKIDLSPIKNLRKLDLRHVRIPILNLPQNTELIQLYVWESSLPHLNLQNGLMLRDLSLQFVPSTTKTEYKEENEDEEEENKLHVEIKLPLSSQLQRLSIGKACLQSLDLSPIINLCTLILHDVTVSKIDLSHNTELSELTVSSFALHMYANDFKYSELDLDLNGQQVPLETSDMIKLDLSPNKKLESLTLVGIALISSPDVRQAKRVYLQDVQMDIDHWREFADGLLSVHEKCRVILKNINDNNIVVDKLKTAGHSIDTPDKFWVDPN